MSQLIVVSGPSGVGKNTLVDAVISNYPSIEYFKKVATRDRRPDDRDTEIDFLSLGEYQELRSRHGVALPYRLRDNDYGLPVTSFAELKTGPKVACLGDFQLVKSLQEAFDTTTVYVTAPIDVIGERLEGREDTPEQRAKSIEAGPKHLSDYERFKELFDYEITNGDDLQAAQEQLIEIIREEVLPHRRMYNFLLPSRNKLFGEAQIELDEEGGFYTSLPTFSEMKETLESEIPAFYFGSGLQPIAHMFMHGPVTIAFYTSKDRERENVANGSFELQGPKKKLAETGALLERLFPELKKYEHRQVRMSRR
jgi:guanylate kinase